MSERVPGTNHRVFDGRGELWDVINRVRDGAQRTFNEAATGDIIDAIFDSGWLYARLAEERERVARNIEQIDYETHLAIGSVHKHPKLVISEAARVAREGER